MENLVFSLNATVPIFLMIVLGAVFKKVKLIDDRFASKMNSFVFKAALPVLLFNDLAVVDLSESWDGKYVLFCFFVTAVSIGISMIVSRFFGRELRGEFIQGSYRSSAALLGIAFIQNIYGTSGMAPVMIIASVPLYNIVAVSVLTIFRPGSSRLDKKTVKKTLFGIVKNPIILGILAGLIWSALRIPMPEILFKSTEMLGRVASPLGLIAMGACFNFDKALGKIKPAITATVMKLVGFCALFLPLAVWMGFRNQALVAILVMLGSSTTVTCYVMAREMGHEGTLSSSIVMLTTLLCGFTLTIWLFILKSIGVI